MTLFLVPVIHGWYINDSSLSVPCGIREKHTSQTMSRNPGEVNIHLSFCFLNWRNHGERDPSQRIAVSAQGRDESVENEMFTLTLGVFFLFPCAPSVYYSLALEVSDSLFICV